MDIFLTLVFLVALVAGAYFLIRLIIAAVRSQPKSGYLKGLIASVIIVMAASVGVYKTRTPEQIAAHQTKVDAEQKATENKKLAEEKRLAEQKAAEESRKQAEQSASVQTSWNKEDLNADTNGNMQFAVKLLRQNSNLADIAVDVYPEDVMKRPWDYYGQVVRFTGKASVLQDYPAGSSTGKALGGECCEIVMTSGDYSTVIVDGILLGSTKGIREGDTVTFVGYPCGISDVQNKLGGTFSHLIVVGKL